MGQASKCIEVGEPCVALVSLSDHPLGHILHKGPCSWEHPCKELSIKTVTWVLRLRAADQVGYCEVNSIHGEAPHKNSIGFLGGTMAWLHGCVVRTGCHGNRISPSHSHTQMQLALSPAQYSLIPLLTSLPAKGLGWHLSGALMNARSDLFELFLPAFLELDWVYRCVSNYSAVTFGWAHFCMVLLWVAACLGRSLGGVHILHDLQSHKTTICSLCHRCP